MVRGVARGVKVIRRIHPRRLLLGLYLYLYLY